MADSASDDAAVAGVGEGAATRSVERFRAILDPDRCSALEAVREDGPIGLSELAARLSDHSDSAEAVRDRRRETVILRHCHLPRLASADLVEVDASGDGVRVRPGERADELDVERVEALADDERRRALSAAVVNAERRRLIRLLADADGTLSTSFLAERLVERTESGADLDSSEDVRSVRLALHHVHLPALEDAGLVEYDWADDRVQPLDVPAQLTALLR